MRRRKSASTPLWIPFPPLDWTSLKLSYAIGQAPGPSSTLLRVAYAQSALPFLSLEDVTGQLLPPLLLMLPIQRWWLSWCPCWCSSSPNKSNHHLHHLSIREQWRRLNRLDRGRWSGWQLTREGRNGEVEATTHGPSIGLPWRLAWHGMAWHRQEGDIKQKSWRRMGMSPQSYVHLLGSKFHCAWWGIVPSSCAISIMKSEVGRWKLPP